MCWYLWLVIIFYSPQKYFLFSFPFSPSSLTLGFSDIWPNILLPLSVCLSSLSLSHTHTQSLVYISSLTTSPDLKLLRAVFMPSYVTWNQQRALDYLQVVEVYFKDTTGKERKSPQEVRLSSTGPGFTKTWDADSWTPWGSPGAHLAAPPKWARLFSTQVMTASLWLFLLHTFES